MRIQVIQAQNSEVNTEKSNDIQIIFSFCLEDGERGSRYPKIQLVDESGIYP